MRWTVKRKYVLIQKYRASLFAEVASLLTKHSISIEEFSTWVNRFEHLGIDGLKVTKTARAP
jgi:glycine cleavage system regulatory protein